MNRYYLVLPVEDKNICPSLVRPYRMDSASAAF